MSIIRLRNINVSFGGPAILESVNLSIDAGERVCLVGRNGTGKSSLLKLISGLIQPDAGELEVGQSIKIALLDQEPPRDLTGSIFEVVADGLGEIAALINEFHQVSHCVAEDASEKNLAELERVQHEIEIADAWKFNSQVESILSKMALDGEAVFEQLSGGMKRRVLLARVLVANPDLLLLDEPTNHLDVSAIQWLEEQLLNFSGALLFVTHDRAFMRKLSTRIVELDRGITTSYPGDYGVYLRRKQENLKAEAEANALFDKKLAQEEVWIRQGIKARRTRNEGRVRALESMREQYRQRRKHIGKVNMKVAEAERSGKIIVELQNVSFSYDDNKIINGLSTTLLRGDKVGIIGPNGAGKTTLLRLLLGELEPDSGSVRRGTKQSVAYFDQLREQLDENASVLDNISEGRERIEINGQEKHVMGYLQEFLFAPERARSPVRSLSGGERNRLLLAKLFSKPANIIVLDEPTNDLDVETLELLEELVLDFDGTVLLVSHDREFLDNVVTSTLVFEGDALVNEYVGGYNDWLRQRKSDTRVNDVDSNKDISGAAGKTKKNKSSVKKTGFKEQHELDALPKKIEALEAEIETLRSQLSKPEFFKQDKEKIVRVQSMLKVSEESLENCYKRWELLESGQ